MDDADRTTRNQLVRARDDARVTIHRGVVLLTLIPVVLIAGLIATFAIGPFGALMAFIVAGAYSLVGGIGGIATIVSGVTEHRKASRELREFDAPRQLPMARLIQR